MPVTTPTGYTPTRVQDLVTKNYVDTRGPRISVQTSAPTPLATNDLWVDTT